MGGVRTSGQRGATLIELIMVIMIAGILGTTVVSFITYAVGAYRDQADRGQLVDSAEMALRRMGRDLRRAIPNSIRVSATEFAVEMINAHAGSRYRTYPTTSGGGDPLAFPGPDDTGFDILAPLSTGYGAADVVVYNLAASGAGYNAYTTRNRYTATNITTNFVSFTSASSGDFPLDSPMHRFFVVDQPVMYRCIGSRLLRLTGYGWSQDLPSTLPTANAVVLADGLDCAASTITYNAGTSQRGGLVTARLVFSFTDSNGNLNQVTLMHQVHVDNAP